MFVSTIEHNVGLVKGILAGFTHNILLMEEELQPEVFLCQYVLACLLLKDIL